MSSDVSPVPRVRAVPLQPHSFFYGGFDLQMHRTLEVMRQHGMDAQPLDFWSRNADYDIVHCWGLNGAHELTVSGARKHGKKVVITHLAPPLTLRGWVRHVGALVEGRRRVQMRMLRQTDRLLVTNELQVESAVRMLRMPREKVEIIPTIIDPRLFDPAPLPSFDDLTDYVACIGNIWPRKNQLRVAQAARKVRCPVLFVGNVMGGEEAYAGALTDIVNSTPYLHWYRWVSEEDLRRIISNSVGVVLPGFDETQPGAALEGAAMGKALLLGDRMYARQKYYQGTYMADPASVDDIAKGLESIRQYPARYTPPRTIIQECHPDSVGKKLKRIMDELKWEKS